MKLVATDSEPYTGRWEFPKSSDQWSGTAMADYEDIKHIVSPPRIVVANARNNHFVVPKVDQYWIGKSMCPHCRETISMQKL